MLKFNAKFAVMVCARDENMREAWAEYFAREMGNFTRTDCTGGWMGELVVETEPNIQMACWTDDLGLVRRLVDLAEMYQEGAAQEAVGLEYAGKFYVVFGGSDWAELRQELGLPLTERDFVG